jgi:hypothetical protein
MPTGAAVAIVGVLAALGASAGDATTLAYQTPPRPCVASRLSAVFAEWSPYTSHQGYYLTITNRSKTTACTVSGPLSARLLGRHGQSLPTQTATYPPGRYTIGLTPGQWARALVTFVDYPLDGEPRPNCEPIAYSLAISIRGHRLIAPMDPARVCGHGGLAFDRLVPVPLVPGCTASAFSATFKGSPGPSGPAGYTLALHNKRTAACYTSSIVSLTLLGNHGQKLPTKASPGVASPFVIAGHTYALVQFFFTTTRGPGEPTTGRCEPNAFTARIGLHPGGQLLVAIKPPFSACDHGAVTVMHMTPP